MRGDEGEEGPVGGNLDLRPHLRVYRMPGEEHDGVPDNPE